MIDNLFGLNLFVRGFKVNTIITGIDKSTATESHAQTKKTFLVCLALNLIHYNVR